MTVTLSVNTLEKKLQQTIADINGKSAELIQRYGLTIDALKGKRIALIGGPAVGKGTIVSLLKEDIAQNYPKTQPAIVEFSKALFAYCARNPSDDEKIRKERMEKGKLVPDYFVNKIFQQDVLPFVETESQKDTTFATFYDGIPRTEDQVHAIQDFGVLPQIAVMFKAKPLVLEHRMYLRNLGLLLSDRKPRDDAMNKERAQKRIEEFEHNYRPLRNALKEYDTHIIDVSAERGPHAVYLEMIALLSDPKNSLFFNERDAEFEEINRLSREYMHDNLIRTFAQGKELLQRDPAKLELADGLAILAKKASDKLYSCKYDLK